MARSEVEQAAQAVRIPPTRDVDPDAFAAQLVQAIDEKLVAAGHAPLRSEKPEGPPAPAPKRP
jgi:hypothetical protein